MARNMSRKWRQRRIRFEWMIRRRYRFFMRRGVVLFLAIIFSCALFAGHVGKDVDTLDGKMIISEIVGFDVPDGKVNDGIMMTILKPVTGLWTSLRTAYSVKSPEMLKEVVVARIASKPGERHQTTYDLVTTDDSAPDDLLGDLPGEIDRLDEFDIATHSTEPLVFIYHSHTSESYRTIPPDRRVDAGFHLMNETNTGITRVGRALADKLEQYGIPVIHSTDIHNYPHHWEAYVNSRETVTRVLDEFPSIQIVLDVHRQGIPDVVWATRLGETDAVMVEVIYTTASDMSFGEHTDWKENEQFAYLLAEKMEQIHPGLLFKVTSVADKRYNQDLFPRMLLLEIGNYLDLEQHAIQAGVLLADAIAAIIDEIDAPSVKTSL